MDTKEAALTNELRTPLLQDPHDDHPRISPDAANESESVGARLSSSTEGDMEEYLQPTENSSLVAVDPSSDDTNENNDASSGEVMRFDIFHESLLSDGFEQKMEELADPWRASLWKVQASVFPFYFFFDDDYFSFLWKLELCLLLTILWAAIIIFPTSNSAAVNLVELLPTALFVAAPSIKSLLTPASYDPELANDAAFWIPWGFTVLAWMALTVTHSKYSGIPKNRSILLIVAFVFSTFGHFLLYFSFAIFVMGGPLWVTMILRATFQDRTGREGCPCVRSLVYKLPGTSLLHDMERQYFDDIDAKVEEEEARLQRQIESINGQLPVDILEGNGRVSTSRHTQQFLKILSVLFCFVAPVLVWNMWILPTVTIESITYKD